MPDPNNPQQRRIAMLIDGDNAQASLIDRMIAETSKYGVVTIRRIYGDFTQPEMKSWKETLHTYAVQPIQQFRYSVGKNATDSALIIDAMDILYTSGVDGFCLVSSDSDYTKLAMRIRDQNLFIMGIGKQLTPRAFVNACDTFVYTENLTSEPRVIPAQTPPPTASSRRRRGNSGRKKSTGEAASEAAAPSAPAAPAPEPKPETTPLPADLNTLFGKAFDLAAGDDGWARLSAVGDRLRQLDPGFDPRTYGHKQLLLLVQAHPEMFELRRRKRKGVAGATIYVRLISEK